MQGPVKTKPPRSGPPPLNKELTKLMAMLAKKSGAMDPRLAGNWADIVGPEMAKLCRPVHMRAVGKARALEVAVANGAAAMQVQFKQDFLIQKLNAYLGRNHVSRIQIRQTGKAGLRQPQKPAYSKPAPAPNRTQERIKPASPKEKLTNALSRMKELMENREG